MHARFGRSAPDPDWPEAGDYLWDAFWDLNAERQDGAHGPQPLSSTSIKDWAIISGHAYLPEELKILRSMAIAWLDAFTAEIASGWKPGKR